MHFRQGIKDGADFIECDVCITKDLIPVCRHESWLNESTNIWENMTLRTKQKTYNVTGYKTVTDIFTVDLTLEELKTIRVKQKYSFRDQNFNYKFQIPTLEEYIQVAKSAGRSIGIYPEVKNPEWVNTLEILRKANTTFEDIVVDVLHKNGYDEPDSLCYVQSFSMDSIRALSKKTKLPLVMLYEYPIPNADTELKNISSICFGIGVWKNMIIPTNKYNYLQSTTDLVSKAHEYDLKVHAYTFRNEDKYLAWNYTQDPYNEYETFLNTRIDGYFTDFPATLKTFLDMKYSTTQAPKPCISGVEGQWKGSYSMISLAITTAITSVMYFI